MDVFVNTQIGSSFPIQVDIYDTVLTMKQKIEKSQGIPVSRQTLYFRGKVLQDDLDITQCEILANSRLLLSISPDIDTNQNNDQGLQTQQSPSAVRPSNQIDEFLNNPDWPLMGHNDQVLHNEQSPGSFDSVEKFLGIQDSPVMVKGESSQVLRDSIGEPIYGEDQALTTDHFSEIQHYSPETSQEIMVRSNKNESSLASNTSAELLGIQDLPSVTLGSNTHQVIQTKKSTPSDSDVKEIIDITDSPANKRIRLSPVKLTVMVMPYEETRKIPVEVDADDKVRELRKELVKMQQRGELDLPKEGYIFIRKQVVLDDDWSFRKNLVAPGDTIEIWRGSYTYDNSTETRVRNRA